MINSTIGNDTITPDLKKRIQAARDKRGILEAIGATVVSVAVQAFRDSALRASAWAPTKRGGKAPLYDTGALKHSIRVISSDNTSVTVGSDRPYAAAHQLGTKPYVITPKTAKALFWPGGKHPVKKVNHPGLPARPFFPFTSGGRATAEASRRIASTIRAKLSPR